jgi:hypothetical protein
MTMLFRTDINRNPTAFTTDVAQEAGLIYNIDYTRGNPFTIGTETYYTAFILGDILATTIKVIDSIGFYTGAMGSETRWSYIGIPYKLWLSFTLKQKEFTIGLMYMIEGGTDMTSLFPKEPV